MLARRKRSLRDVVAKKLKEDCSAQQIAGWLARRYPDDEVMHVSHETIYRTLFVQTKGALKKELLAHLHSGRTMRKARCASTSGQSSAGRSKTPSRSVSAQQGSKTGRCPDIGKGTCSPGHVTPTSSPPLSSVAPGS